MNHTLTQNPFHLDYPVTSESDYLSQARQYPNTPIFQTDDLLHHGRKASSAGHSLAQPLDVPVNNVIQYATQPTAFHDAQCHPTSSFLLSPPNSYSGSNSVGTNSVSSSFPYSTVPYLYPSDATKADSYSSVSSSVIPQLWNDKTMTGYTRRVPALPPPSLSSPLSNGATQSMPGPPIGAPRNVGDPYSPPYSAMNRPAFGQSYSSSPDISRNGALYPMRSSDNYGSTFPPPSYAYNQLPTMSMDQSSRSSQTRQDGPPFGETKVINPVMTARGQQLMPDITASIQKGFFQVDNKWTCYRRNYFTVSCSFNLRTQTFDTQLYLQRGSQSELINQFAVSISAKTAGMNSHESEVRALVQHTPKRDKATESVPGKVVVQASQPSSIGTLTNDSHNMYGASQHVAGGMISDYNGSYGAAQHQTPPTSHVFERIQFQKATANNGKRRAQQQYFHVVVELSADIGRAGETKWVTIATKQSDQMVVRGRSPGHYKDTGRRDSTSSLDRDPGTGSGGDPGLGLSSMSSLLGGSRGNGTSMDWDVSYRGGGHAGTRYRQFGVAGYSPISTVSTPSTSDSAMDDEQENRKCWKRKMRCTGDGGIGHACSNCRAALIPGCHALGLPNASPATGVSDTVGRHGRERSGPRGAEHLIPFEGEEMALPPTETSSYEDGLTSTQSLFNARMEYETFKLGAIAIPQSPALCFS